jgi:predicted N-formylglutamate amidohydrolase
MPAPRCEHSQPMSSPHLYPLLSTHTPACEVVRATASHLPPVVFTCEHASNQLPAKWSWPEEDQWIRGTHWAFDIGAAEVTRRLVERVGAVGVLAKFSRLLVDPNRDLAAGSLYRKEAEGKPLGLNAILDPADTERRVQDFYRPYHQVVDRCIQEAAGAPVLAIHSFTPVYAGNARSMEIGVLFDHSDDLGLRVADALREEGFKVALNEPYSGKNGMMFSAYRHAFEHQREALEFELRQDLLGSPEACVAVADRVFQALKKANAL